MKGENQSRVMVFALQSFAFEPVISYLIFSEQVCRTICMAGGPRLKTQPLKALVSVQTRFCDCCPCEA